MAHGLASVSHRITEQVGLELAFPMFIHIGSLAKLDFLKRELSHSGAYIRTSISANLAE